jgi:histidine triad (HIT) family protein
MNECLICRIIRKEEQIDLSYEDAYTVAFLYTSPIAAGHTIVAPKMHFADIFDAEQGALAAVMKTVQVVSQKMRNEQGASGVNLVSNNGRVAGQEVPHFHVHIVPRREGDKLGLVSFSGNLVSNSSGFHQPNTA